MSSSKSKGGEQRKRETSPDRKPNNNDNTPKKSLDDSDEDKDKNSGDIRRSSRPQKRKLLDQDFFESDLAAKKPKLNHPSSPTPSQKSSTLNKSNKSSSSKKKDKKSSSKNKSKDDEASSSSSSSRSSKSSKKSSSSSSNESSASSDDEKSSKKSSSSSSSESDDEKSSSSSKSSKSSSSSRSSKSSKSSSSASSKSSKSSSSSNSSKSSKNSKSKDDSSSESGGEEEQAKQPLIRMFWTESEERALVDALRKGPFVSFQKILDEIKDEFHPSRTAKSLEAHFYRMKRKGVVDRDIPLENLPKPSKVKRQSFTFKKARRKSEPRKRKPRPKKAKNTADNNEDDQKQSSEEESSSESGEEKSSKKEEEKSKEENKSKSKSEKSSTATAKDKSPTKKNTAKPNTKNSEKKSTPAKKDSTNKSTQKKDAASDEKKTPQKKDQAIGELKKSTDSTTKKSSSTTLAKSTTDNNSNINNSNKKVASRSTSNVSRQSVEDNQKDEPKSSENNNNNTTGSSSNTTPFKKITKDYSKANRSKKAEDKSMSGPTSATEENTVTKVSSPPTTRTPSSRARKDRSAEESSPVLSPMQPQVRSKRISERRERQLKEGTSESNSFRHADYIDSSLISTPPSAPETIPLPEDDTSNSAINNSAMEIDQDGRSPQQQVQPLKKSRSNAGSSNDKFFEFETACLEEAIRNQAQFEHFITSIDTVDATLAKIDYSIKEIQTLQNIQKLEREIERALDMHGIRDSSLALLRGFHLRYTMKTQKIILGRPTANNTVDVNLLDENSEDGNKISRRQALIKLKYDGEFYIKNLGSQNLYVNGELVRTGNRKKLSHNCLIEVGDVSLIFEINKHQLQMIRDRLQELEDQELAEQQRLEEERKQRELSLAAELTNNNNNMNSQMMNVNDFLADPHPPVAGVQPDPMQLEPANGLPSASS